MDTLPLDAFEIPATRVVAGNGVAHPVAAVLINTALPQLAQALDFRIDPQYDSRAVVGSLVKVKVSEQNHLGVVVSRKDSTDWQKPLRGIEGIASPLPLLSPTDLELLDRVALHYGVFPAQLLKYVLPNRRAEVEKSFTVPDLEWNLADKLPQSSTEISGAESLWARYRGGAQWFDALRAGSHPRAVVTSLPKDNAISAPPRFQDMAQLVQAVWARGEQSLLIYPTAEQATQAFLYLQRYFGAAGENIVLYSSQASPASQYRAFLAARFGRAAVVVGTRGAAFLPLEKPGLFYCWDNLHFALNSDMSPNFSARQVLLYRTDQSKASLVFEHYCVHAADLQLVQRGFAQGLSPDRTRLRESTARITVPDTEDLQSQGPSAGMLLPDRAVRIARQGLRRGPVLVLIPPDGEFSVVSCANCAQNAVCLRCHGPLQFRGSRLECARCGQVATDYSCPRCGSTRLRGRHLVSRTVIDDIGVNFKNTPVVVSRPGAEALDQIDQSSRLVVANPGAEPIAIDGYQAAIVLRPHMLSSRNTLWRTQEIMRRWLAAASLVAPGKPFYIAGGLEETLAQSLIRWDPWGTAQRDLLERLEGGFAPAWRTATIESAHIETVVDYLGQALEDFSYLGPVASRRGGGYRLIFVSVPLRQGPALGKALRALTLQMTGYRKGQAGGLYIQVDPEDPGGQVG